ncbi:ThiF family adenylyltransferase [Legionella sp. D16C41]|uniref:ThiF family adenylyltransferase n=1 Tax=Legionella sp. D16C41 TaxID=3402688 RepID=UPI003AF52DEF
MLNHSLSNMELERYAQQIKLKEIGLTGQEKLKNARVLCIGLGGLGSPLLLYLAAAGVGTIGIVDDDVVEVSNLHRQVLYRTSHVTLPKTSAALAQIIALNPLITVHTYSEKITTDNAAELISQYDIVADGSDNFSTRYLVHDFCFALSRPYVYASAAQFQGHSAVFFGQRGPCLRCLFPVPANNSKVTLNCNEAGVFGVVPGILGSIQAAEIIKWILKIGNSLERRLLVVDLLTMVFKEIKLVQNPECQLCIHQQFLSDISIAIPSLQNINLRDYAISANQLLTNLQQNKKIILLDVRSEEEHAIQNIGGKNIPLAQLTQRLNELSFNDNIIIYCQSGKRSMDALNILLTAGFTSVQYLKDSIDKMLHLTEV